ncbi:hypothetical protein I1A62_01735 (plasmid) [Rhodococcus sp. USK10]|nr:hypothetical protein I1A62_01735 [Rhodococcus sp. USK10]
MVIVVPDSYADIVERLCGEFDGRVPLPVVTQIVRQCRRDANGSDLHFPADPTPRGLEGLARRRLLAAAGRGGTTGSGDETS